MKSIPFNTAPFESQHQKSGATLLARPLIYWLLFGSTLLILLHIPLAWMPLGRDQGVWSGVGLALSQGEIFFKDILHFNLPGLGVSFALLSPLSDDPRVLTAAISLVGSLVILWSMAGLLLPATNLRTTQYFIMLFVCICPPVLSYWNIAQKDYMSMAFIVAACYLLSIAEAQRPKRLILVFLSGLAVAIAAMYKPIFAITGVCLAMAEFSRLQLFNQDRQLPKTIISLTLLLLGFLSLLSCFIYYLVINHALDDAYHAVFQFAVWYAGNKDHSAIKMALFLLAWTNMSDAHTILLSIIQAFIWLPLVVYGVACITHKKYWSKAYWFYIPGVIALFSYFIQQKGFPYHAMPWVIFSFALVAIAFDKLVMHTRNKPVFRGIIAVMAIFLLIKNLFFLPYGTGLLPYLAGFDSRENYLTTYYTPTDSPHPNDSESAAQWIKANSLATDKIAVWDMENQLYALSGRLFSTRHHFSFFLEANITPSTPLGQWQQALQKQYSINIQTQPPAYFVFKFYNPDPKHRLIRDLTIAKIPGVVDFIERHYTLAQTYGRLDIYQLNKH